MLLDLNKETIFIAALEKIHMIGRGEGVVIVNGYSGERNTDPVFLT